MTRDVKRKLCKTEPLWGTANLHLNIDSRNCLWWCLGYSRISRDTGGGSEDSFKLFTTKPTAHVRE